MPSSLCLTMVEAQVGDLGCPQHRHVQPLAGRQSCPQEDLSQECLLGAHAGIPAHLGMCDCINGITFAFTCACMCVCACVHTHVCMCMCVVYNGFVVMQLYMQLCSACKRRRFSLMSRPHKCIVCQK